MPALPDVPTMEEIGITGMDISFWHGLWAPKGTPKDIVDKLNAAVGEGVGRSGGAEARRRARHDASRTQTELTPQALHDFHKAELDKWWPIIKSYGIKIVS